MAVEFTLYPIDSTGVLLYIRDDKGVRMSNTSWKQLEREVGLLVDGKRYPANQGGKVDVEGTVYIVQVKERKSLSLEVLTQLVEEIEQIAAQRGKRGLVAVKVRRGRGKPSPILIVQSATQWSQTQKPLA